jgi:hypothetical protein
VIVLFGASDDGTSGLLRDRAVAIERRPFLLSRSNVWEGVTSTIAAVAPQDHKGCRFSNCLYVLVVHEDSVLAAVRVVSWARIFSA